MLISLSDPLAARLELAGGKGRNLALLAQRGFPVPAGVVVSADAYRAFVAGADETLSALADVARDDLASLSAGAARVRAALAARPLPPSLAIELRRWLGAAPAGA